MAEARTDDAVAVAVAEVALSKALALYVRDQRHTGDETMTFADPSLKSRSLSVAVDPPSVCAPETAIGESTAATATIIFLISLLI